MLPSIKMSCLTYNKFPATVGGMSNDVATGAPGTGALPIPSEGRKNVVVVLAVVGMYS